ncbi:MAG TPA: alginate export family protein [Candidatus Omnitrophota bacterium]|nr:alginate export family protein [Candidatus Omnitrophota bacterium]
MSKRLILVLALVMMAGMTCAAYAEVQNVKVSGDITIMGVARENLDLAKDPVGSGKPSTGSAGMTTINTNTYQDREAVLESITRVRVDADLTDNVMTSVRLINERNWNGDSGSTTNSYSNIGLNNAEATNHDQQIDLDLAYVTLKEFLYSPLTMTIGRQEIKFGNGFIVGKVGSLRSGLATGDLTMRKSFDAIRATLDYNPLVIDGIYAKVEENNSRSNDDVTLAGLNAAYELTKSTTVEGFFFSKARGSNAAAVTNVDTGVATSFDDATTNKQKADVVNTVGARVVNKSVKDLTLDAQAAFQFGSYNPKFDPNARYIGTDRKAGTSERRAWAAQVTGTYDLKDLLNKNTKTEKLSKYDPRVAATYVFYSGSDRNKVSDKSYTGWDPMFQDQTFGSLLNAMFAKTNMHIVELSAMAKPKDDLSVKIDWVWARLAKRYEAGNFADLSGVSGARQFIMSKERYLGQEVDATITYDYTEDVQFSLLGGIFMPGSSINDTDGTFEPNRAAATELIGTMKVTF